MWRDFTGGTPGESRSYTLLRPLPERRIVPMDHGSVETLAAVVVLVVRAMVGVEELVRVERLVGDVGVADVRRHRAGRDIKLGAEARAARPGVVVVKQVRRSIEPVLAIAVVARPAAAGSGPSAGIGAVAVVGHAVGIAAHDGERGRVCPRVPAEEPVVPVCPITVRATAVVLHVGAGVVLAVRGSFDLLGVCRAGEQQEDAGRAKERAYHERLLRIRFLPLSRKAPRVRVSLYAPLAPVARRVPAAALAPSNPPGTNPGKTV